MPIANSATSAKPKVDSSMKPAILQTGINVKALGAVGDGKKDDTSAFKRAITEGARKKLPVLLPQGNYRITEPLTIAFQSLVGSEPGGWNADAIPMPSIVVDHEKGPALTMLDAASVYGIAFVYKVDQKKCPPTILLKGNGPNIQNVRIQYCWDGIISDHKSNPGRLNIENVFIVSPGGTAVYVSGTLDIPTVRNIEVWNNLNRPNVTAFKFGYNDCLRASQLFAFNTQVGFELADPVGDEWKSGTWGTFTDCNTDAVSISWKSTGVKVHRIGILGGLYWAHHMFLELDNPNVEIRAVNNDIQTNGAPAIMVKNTGPLSISNARFCRAFENAATPFVYLINAKSFILSNCSFTDQSPILHLGAGSKRILISNNIFDESKFPLILNDNRAPDATVLINNNIGK
ncbi:MAG: right-handed parallel beta-helix repeat-containing protein [Armatimonadota bacterium]